jgi:LPXTG-motif cell wall-anchored protein
MEARLGLRRRVWRAAATAGVALALVGGSAVSGVVSPAGAGEIWYPGEPTCEELGYTPPPAADGWDDTGRVDPPVNIDNEYVTTTLHDFDEAGQPYLLDVEAKPGFEITAVIIRGELATNLHPHEPWEGLFAPPKEDGSRSPIVHYSVCGTVSDEPPSNPTCADLGFVAPPAAEGWDETGLVDPPVSIDNEFVTATVSDLDESGQPFVLDVEAKSGFVISAVIVSGADSVTKFDEEPFTQLEAPATADGERSAISDYTICGSTSDEPTPPEEVLTLDILEPICDGDVPYLEYAVDAEGFDATEVRMVWDNPSGDDFVYDDLPFSGRVLWPGAVVDDEGNPLGWPGWVQEADGTWVEGGPWQWVRPSVEVTFEVNPTKTVTVDYPPSSPECATNPPTDGLPETGANQVWPTLAGVALVLGGVALLVTRTRLSMRK